VRITAGSREEVPGEKRLVARATTTTTIIIIIIGMA
jgi:hypothetical protein